ncbi:MULTISPECIES: hypothetical protein [Kitasatospora]|uniref:CBM6 domain-containing protein n=1 Tax=Kitasatospora setae (strain ATCC 33774 / DSM 43861 / JCM 3304 / KCC A-0304 / NBRC 14216 / KM-6054) TaxID=452652 RepID=E4NFA0_KITSK|nr:MULTISPECIES: hypothetical protein [Kitasatospora]BAJ30180.1 hypothetical protein KSE_43970 [Kitasatospora setae KM-6054]
MTTPGSNGAAPEGPEGEDDPFAYLYRPAEGEQPAAERPRSGYSRPMEVGRASYGERPAYQQAPSAGPPPGAGPAYEPTGAMPQQSRYAERSRPRPGEDGPAGRGKAAIIGAVAVVAAIAIGAGVALSTGDPGGKANAADPTGKAASAPATGSASPTAAASSAAPSPTAATEPVSDASKLQAQGAASANAVKGAISADGGYLVLQAGSSVTWTVNSDAGGQTKLWLHFNNTGADQPAQVTVNGKDHQGGVTFKNYSKNPAADPAQSWFSTNIWPVLQPGPNTITLTLPAGAGSTVLLDQVALTPMSVGDYPK